MSLHVLLMTLAPLDAEGQLMAQFHFHVRILPGWPKYERCLVGILHPVPSYYRGKRNQRDR